MLNEFVIIGANKDLNFDEATKMNKSYLHHELQESPMTKKAYVSSIVENITF